MSESIVLAIQIAAYSSLAHLFLVRPGFALLALAVSFAGAPDDSPLLAQARTKMVEIIFVPYLLLALLAIGLVIWSGM